MSMRSSTSTASSSSTHSNTTRGYKAYKLIRKEQSPASLSPITSRRSSLTTLPTTDSEPTDTESDSEELFDLSFDSPSGPEVAGARMTAAKGAARTTRTTMNSRRSSWASRPTTGRTSEEHASGSHCSAYESNSHGHGSEASAPTNTAATPPLRRTLIKPLITASTAQSTYLPLSPRIPPPPIDSSRLARSLPLPRSPAGARQLLTPDAAKASRLPRPQRAPPNRSDGTRITKPAALASLYYYSSDSVITN